MKTNAGYKTRQRGEVLAVLEGARGAHVTAKHRLPTIAIALGQDRRTILAAVKRGWMLRLTDADVASRRSRTPLVLLGDRAWDESVAAVSIDQVAAGLIVSARDDDGVIEAVELPGEDFVVAVQWHPEESLEDLRLFDGIVAAAHRYAAERVSR